MTKRIIKEIPKSGFKVNLNNKNAFGKSKFLSKKEAQIEADELKRRKIKGIIKVVKVKINRGDFK